MCYSLNRTQTTMKEERPPEGRDGDAGEPEDQVEPGEDGQAKEPEPEEQEHLRGEVEKEREDKLRISEELQKILFERRKPFH